VRVDLLVTDRPITPSGTGRAAPRLCWSGVSGRRVADAVVHLLDLSQAEDPGASEITKDQPFGGGPSRKLNNIIGVWGIPLHFPRWTAGVSSKSVGLPRAMKCGPWHLSFALRVSAAQ